LTPDSTWLLFSIYISLYALICPAMRPSNKLTPVSYARRRRRCMDNGFSIIVSVGRVVVVIART